MSSLVPMTGNTAASVSLKCRNGEKPALPPRTQPTVRCRRSPDNPGAALAAASASCQRCDRVAGVPICHPDGLASALSRRPRCPRNGQRRPSAAAADAPSGSGVTRHCGARSPGCWSCQQPHRPLGEEIGVDLESSSLFGHIVFVEDRSLTGQTGSQAPQSARIRRGGYTHRAPS